MSLNRREFFAGLLALWTVKALPGIQAPVKPQLGLAALQEAYNSCCYGREHPDQIIVSQKTWGQIINLFQLQQRFSRSGMGMQNLVFNDALITPDRFLADDQILFRNTRKLTDSRFNTILHLT